MAKGFIHNTKAEEKHGKIEIEFEKENKMEQTIKTIFDELTLTLKDNSCYIAWQANIAMPFQDAYYRHVKKTKKRPTLKDIHEISNIAAKEFLDLFCKHEIMRLKDEM